MDHCSLLLFRANEKWDVHVYSMKLVTEMHYQVQTCTTMLRERERERERERDHGYHVMPNHRCSQLLKHTYIAYTY